MAVHVKYIKQTNAYVNEQAGYAADSIAVALDDATFEVTAFPVDVYGNQVAGTSKLVDKTFTNLTDAVNYWNGIQQQVDQGDVIRNV